ncbi:MAG: Uma2 family endonuclease [Candidatus Dormibacteraceae bacterium]
MAALTLQLPPLEEQKALNLQRWAEISADRDLARIEGRIETDRYGRIVMSPPPAPDHGSFQSKIAQMLWNLMNSGRVFTECPISTADGVKAADVAWASPACLKELGRQVCFTRAPEICVEVLSPGNTRPEILEKTRLYFDAGAREVWLCELNGEITFLGPEQISKSGLCPEFPGQIRF